MKSVLQDWVMELPFMQQSVLLAALRGPDGVMKNHPSKQLLKWYRRCIVLSAFDKKVLDNPYDLGGGSYTGPSIKWDDIPLCGVKPKADWAWEIPMEKVLRDYMDSQDSLPLHFYLHILHAIEIIGYKHSNYRIRLWWYNAYLQMAKDLHMYVEPLRELDRRLNDCEQTWKQDNSRCTEVKITLDKQ